MSTAVLYTCLYYLSFLTDGCMMSCKMHSKEKQALKHMRSGEALFNLKKAIYLSAIQLLFVTN